jgi:hypothetical protein
MVNTNQIVMRNIIFVAIAILTSLNTFSQTFCSINGDKLQGMTNQKVMTAIGRINGGLIPDGGDIWGSAIFRDEKTNNILHLSYFGMYLQTNKLDDCICCSPQKYKNQRVEIHYTYDYKWIPIAIEGIKKPIDKHIYSEEGFGKRDRIIEFKGKLISSVMGDAAHYVTIKDEMGSICEFSYGYVDMKYGNLDDYINKNVKVVVAREWNYNLIDCKVLSH